VKLQPVPLFGLGNEGRSAVASAQSRVNLYVELQQDPEAGSKLVMYPTPGLVQVLDLGASPTRGAYAKDTLRYLVNGTTLWEVSPDGSLTSRGTLQPTTGRVDIVDNGDELLIVDGTYGYTYDFATTTLTQIADVDFLASDTCAFLNGFFLVGRANSAEWAISDLYDGTAWDPLDFATAESDPDNLVRLAVNNGVVCLFGNKTIEFWGDSGAEDFPFARIGSSAIQYGLEARWSLARFSNSSLMFLGKNELGAVQVFMLVGSNVGVVSTPELEFQFSQYTTSTATAFSYVVNGHPMYHLSFPTDDVTWVYDGQSKEWHEARSGEGRHRGEIHITSNGNSYVTDYENGKLYRVDQDAMTDGGETIIREWTSRHIKSANFSRMSELWIDMETGVGLQTGQGSDPQVMLQISRDGGRTWGAEIWRSFGAVGNYTARAVWRRLGRARNWTFRVRVSDPVKTVFTGAWGRYGGQ
jgi:hypothetical protein